MTSFTLSAKSAVAIVVFFVVVALFAPFCASPFPVVVFENKSSFEIPASPLFSALFSSQTKGKMKEIPFRELAHKKEISALFAPVPYSPYEKELNLILYPPSFDRFGHYMGTDEVGRDVAARMIHGAKNSMLVGLVAVSISLFFGILVGALSGYFGGVVDLILSRLVEIVITFPQLILIMAVLALLQPSLFNIMVVIGLTSWTGIARVIRGEFLKRKNFEFVEAARVMGASHLRIILVHILPNSIAPVLVMASFGIAGAVLIESSLSFLGIGIVLPEPSWGQLLNVSRSYIDFAWWMTGFPGFAIFLVVVSYNLLGDYLRKALNPRESH